jgi:hypothetical protein
MAGDFMKQETGRTPTCRLRSIPLKPSQRSAPIQHLHFVQGEVFIRDGRYIHETMWLYKLTGIYNILTGNINFFMAPFTLESSTLMKDFVMRYPFNDTEAFTAYIIGVTQNPPPVQKPSKNSRNICVYQGLMKAELFDKPLDSIEPQPNIHFLGEMTSPNCGSKLKLEIQTFYFENFYNSLSLYSIMVALVAIIETVVTIYQINFSSSQSGYARISMLTVSIQAMLDAYACLLHIAGGILYDPLFTIFSVTAFLKFMLFTIFEMRYLFSIWKSRRPDNFQQWENARNEYQTLYTRFYGGMFLIIILMYQLSHMFAYIVFALYSFWIPQIYCNFSRDSKKSVSPLYVIVISACRLVFPAYFLGCPYNIMSYQPNFSLLTVLIIWVSFQCCILCAQHVFGPRFFIPTLWQPEKYDYKRELDPSVLQDQTCVVCIHPVDQNDYMITPCNHIFHSECLSKWMDEKLECPHCRAALPER